MESWRTASAVIGILLVAIYALGSGIWTSNTSYWYSSLNRPAWQPPDWVFGVIWPYNFIVIGISAFVLSKSLSKNLVIMWLVLFTASVAAALFWAYLFYVPHNLVGAAIALPLAAIITIPITVITFKVSIGYGLAFSPYQIWVVLASSLSIGYAIRN
jgi:tryptophan-rich sensory protein